METKLRFDSLTGLRGLFSLIIVFFHTLPATPLISRIPLTSLIGLYGGMMGNYFFFMCSGLMMSIGYRQRISEKKITFQSFFVKRLCKLYPLYLITNLVSLVINTFQFGFSAINLKRIIFTVLLQNGGGLSTEYPYNGPSWFISALFVCYIVFFFMAYHAKNPTQYYCMIAFGIVWGYSLAAGRIVAPLAFAHHGDSFFAFFVGCALAEIYPRLSQTVNRWLPPVSVVLLVGSGVLMLRYGVEIITGDVRVAFACLLYPLLIHLALSSKWLSLFLQSGPIRYLGKISFSVYLWHFVVYDFFRYTYGKTIGDPQYLAYLVLVLVVSVLSNKYIENRNWSRKAERIQ